MWDTYGLRFVQKALYQNDTKMQSLHCRGRDMEREESGRDNDREGSGELHEFYDERE